MIPTEEMYIQNQNEGVKPPTTWLNNKMESDVVNEQAYEMKNQNSNQMNEALGVWL